MRFVYYLGVLLVAAVSLGCQKKEAEETIIRFDVVDTWQATVDVRAFPGETLTTFLSASSIRSAVADSSRRNNTTLEQLQQATLEEAVVTLQAPAGQNFDFVRQLTLHITSEQGNDRMVLATRTDVPLGATTLTLTPTTAPLLNYLRPGRYYLQPQLELRQPGWTVARVQIQFRYQVQGRRP